MQIIYLAKKIVETFIRHPFNVEYEKRVIYNQMSASKEPKVPSSKSIYMYLCRSDDRTSTIRSVQLQLRNRRCIGFRALHLRAALEQTAFLSGPPFYDRYVHLVQTLDSPQWPSVVCQVGGCTCSKNRAPFPPSIDLQICRSYIHCYWQCHLNFTIMIYIIDVLSAYSDFLTSINP